MVGENGILPHCDLHFCTRDEDPALETIQTATGTARSRSSRLGARRQRFAATIRSAQRDRVVLHASHHPRRPEHFASRGTDDFMVSRPVHDEMHREATKRDVLTTSRFPNLAWEYTDKQIAAPARLRWRSRPEGITDGGPDLAALEQIHKL
jgi:hypothetical protein